MKKLQKFQEQALTTQGSAKTMGGYDYTWGTVETITYGNTTIVITENSQPD
ncbi:MAG: hypothetical protein AAFQ98_08230 [Bacteroidota bacterium]